jgi:nucleoid DNA-binding protein
MNKSDLIKALKDEANLTKPEAKAAVNFPAKGGRAVGEVRIYK